MLCLLVWEGSTRFFFFCFLPKCKTSLIFGIETRHFSGVAFEDFDPKIWLTGVMTAIVCSVYLCGKDLKKCPETFASFLYRRISLGGWVSGIALLSLCGSCQNHNAWRNFSAVLLSQPIIVDGILAWNTIEEDYLHKFESASKPVGRARTSHPQV